MPRTVLGSLGALLLLAAPGTADDKDQLTPAAERFKALERAMEKAEEEFNDAYPKAKTDADRRDALAKFTRQQQDAARQFLELARKHPKDPVAFDCLAKVVTLGTVPEADQATDLLVRDHLRNPKVAQVCEEAARLKTGEKLLRAVLAGHPDREVRGRACFFLAQHLAHLANTVYLLEHGGDFIRQQMTASRGAEAIKRLQERDPARLRKEAEQLLDQIKAKYGDVRYGDEPLGDKVAGERFELLHLSLGKPAPEIEGEDVDGKKFKLSDYRGKVVLLDFWGNW
jgi:hypothetical protein